MGGCIPYDTGISVELGGLEEELGNGGVALLHQDGVHPLH